MATINQIPMTIMGNIVKDLEPKRTAGGKTVITFRVAQTSSTERNGKWEDGETTCRIRRAGGSHDRFRYPQRDQGHRHRPIRATRLADRNGREAQQLRTQRRRHRCLHPLCHGPDRQSQRIYRRAADTPIAADPTSSAGPTSERRSMVRRGPGPFRRTTGTCLLKNKNSKAHDI